MISDYLNKENECEKRFLEKGKFWHLCTPGSRQEIIFKNDDDYKFGMTSSAMSLHEMNVAGKRLQLYAFALMSNHIHNLLCGSEEDCLEYFRIWKMRLQRYFINGTDLSTFDCQIIPIDNLKSFRYEAAYINRNGFVNNRMEIPFSYEWSSGRYYFNPVTRDIPLTRIGDISCRKKKALLRSRVTDFYDSLEICSGYISPICFCEIRDGENLYNSPHQYFNFLYKSVEEYSLIAKRLSDNIFLNDSEMFTVAYIKSKEMYKIDDPKLLNKDDKIQMAKLMHHDYNASNGQIQRILKLDRYLVDSIFPKAK